MSQPSEMDVLFSACVHETGNLLPTPVVLKICLLYNPKIIKEMMSRKYEFLGPPVFRRNVSAQYSGWKRRSSRKPAESRHKTERTARRKSSLMYARREPRENRWSCSVSRSIFHLLILSFLLRLLLTLKMEAILCSETSIDFYRI
jgi:hypothetical protein